MKRQISSIMLGVVLLATTTLSAAPSADEVLADAKAKASGSSKAVFLVFGSPG
ncbi:MAG: hypothetical protein HY735_15485 [Verrucomicrobia bacterium]|nr:hypothetical protein [Verrucomicrobiota bacterium]